MEQTGFQIIFDKLSEAVKTDNGSVDWAIVSESTREELDEIAELRRLSNELTPPDISCYTTT